MRLAIIRRRFDPHGGAERFILTAASALISAGETVTVIAESWAGGDAPGLKRQQVPRGGFTRAGKNRHFQKAVAGILAAGGFDLVQSHERLIGADIFRAGDGVHAAWVDRLGRERGRLGALALQFDAMHRLVMDTERRMVADGRTLFVANSELVADELRAWLKVPEQRLRVIENGVDLDRFRPTNVEEKAAARRGFGLPEDAPVVAFVGSGFERKGAFKLVEALRAPSLAGAHLLIAGRDRRGKALAERVARLGLGDRVRLLGGLDDVRPVYAAADLFALPSLYDPMPNAALEALASGLPAVVTPDTGIAAHIAATGAGAVASRDAEALSAVLATVIADLPARAGKARTLATRFDLTAATDRWRDLYREFQ
jgi:UDP-glucose:(heptosyl)LPS alpha-1,3-glucosyltransferase